MIKIGEHVPEITFEVYHNGEAKQQKLSDYKGKWLALVFYPGDFTFICPTELEELTKLHDSFQELDSEIVSVSTDSVHVHKAWHDASPSIKNITFPMAADPAGKLCRTFGTYLEEKGVSLRGSFVIDPDGIVRTIEISHNDIGRSGKELLRKIQAAKFVHEHNGLVCPASWEPGNDTLEPDMDLVGKL